MTHKGTQPLQSGRLLLRRFTTDDADTMYANWAGDPEVTRYLFWDAHPDALVTHALLTVWTEQYKKDGYYNWAIALDGQIIGNISVVDCSDRDEWAEIGYCIGKDYWGRGIMTDALSAVLGFLFDEVGLHRVYLKHDIENVGSGRVMIKNGLTLEGLLRGQHRRKDGTWADLRVYGMLQNEWRARHART